MGFTVIMRIFLAWHNTFQNKKRTLAAMGGISFSLLLIFMQLGFLITARITAGLVYEFFDYDLIITSAAYESMDAAGSFAKTRLVQANVVPGVEQVATLNYYRARWRDPAQNYLGSSCMLLGYDLNSDFIRDEETKSNLKGIVIKDNVMLDRYSHPDYGEKRIDKVGTINWREVTIAALYKLGISFHAEGSAIVNLDTFQMITHGDPSQATFGLVKVSPGTDVKQVMQGLRDTLPPDVMISERQNFIRTEQDYFIKVKPIGIMFQAGSLVAFIVGAVILFQVLSAEISARINEYATVKAVGFGNSYIYKVGAQQAIIFALMSYIPALPMGHGVSYLVQKTARLPMYLTYELAIFVLLLALLMCTISGILALRKVRRADPADLF
jgi:putative ABC transport system permease protein